MLNVYEEYGDLINTYPEMKQVIDSITSDYTLAMRKMTHEFGNALTLVNSSLQIIESSHPEVHDFKYWNSTIDDVHYLIQLVSELSVFNNSSKLNLETVNLQDLISNIANAYKIKNDSENISINLHVVKELPTITADKTKLKQAFINLIKNSYEALDSSKPNSYINITLTHGTKYIYILVEDNGCGISEEQLSQIFNPLVTFKPTGTGLGLPISKRIITAHNGSISVTSEVDQGTCFQITLPIKNTTPVQKKEK